MAWEQRRHGNYYYRSKRVGGRVVHEYRGNGPVALLESLEDDVARDERRAEREAARARVATLRAVGAALDEQLALVRAQAAGLLKRLGFHEHRGHWRRKR